MYLIEENKPPRAKEGIALYLDAGWGKPEDYVDALEVFEGAYRNSRFVTARKGDQLVGMIRFLTDGFHDTQIIECIVLKEHQRKGIAKSMLNKIKELCSRTSIYIQSTENFKDVFLKEEFAKHSLIGLSFIERNEKQ